MICGDAIIVSKMSVGKGVQIKAPQNGFWLLFGRECLA
jgi:hypothetical protein